MPYGRIRPWHILAGIAMIAALDLYEALFSLPRLAALAQGERLPDFHFGYAPAALGDYVRALGAQGHGFFLSWHLPADMALAIIEPAIIALIILRFTRQGDRWALPLPAYARAGLLLFPAGMASFDVLENSLMAALMRSGHAPSAQIAAVMSFVTQTKWVFAVLALGLAVVLPLIGLGRVQLHRRSR